MPASADLLAGSESSFYHPDELNTACSLPEAPVLQGSLKNLLETVQKTLRRELGRTAA